MNKLFIFFNKMKGNSFNKLIKHIFVKPLPFLENKKYIHNAFVHHKKHWQIENKHNNRQLEIDKQMRHYSSSSCPNKQVIEFIDLH